VFVGLAPTVNVVRLLIAVTYNCAAPVIPDAIAAPTTNPDVVPVVSVTVVLPVVQVPANEITEVKYSVFPSHSMLPPTGVVNSV